MTATFAKRNRERLIKERKREKERKRQLRRLRKAAPGLRHEADAGIFAGHEPRSMEVA